MTKDEFFKKSEELAEMIKRLKVERWRRLNRPLEFTESQPDEQIHRVSKRIKEIEAQSWQLLREFTG